MGMGSLCMQIHARPAEEAFTECKGEKEQQRSPIRFQHLQKDIVLRKQSEKIIQT